MRGQEGEAMQNLQNKKKQNETKRNEPSREDELQSWKKQPRQRSIGNGGGRREETNTVQAHLTSGRPKGL
jgi:hypothetical protein